MRWEFIKEKKKVRNQELEQESDQENKKKRKKTRSRPRKRPKKRKTFFLSYFLVFFYKFSPLISYFWNLEYQGRSTLSNLISKDYVYSVYRSKTFKPLYNFFK